MIKQFKEDVLKGLSNTPKQLSSKYFYDKKGDELFVQIMQLEEYYLTNCELDIFKNKTDELITEITQSTDEEFELIELGAGDGTKTFFLLERLLQKNFNFTYVPIDISPNTLNVLETKIKAKLPSLNISPQQGEYFAILPELKKRKKKKVVLFLGSNIGNLSDENSKLFLEQLSKNLNPSDQLILGVDLIKPKEIVLPAYNDSKGITAEFNLNLLRRINRELDADFKVDSFKHSPHYDEESGIAESYIESLENQTVSIKALDTSFSFKKGEKIFTEISRKYNSKIIKELSAQTNFKLQKAIKDNKEYFSNYIFIRN